MKLSRIGRFGMALVVSAAMSLGMTACGGYTVGYMWVLGTQFNGDQSAGQIGGFKIDDFTGNLTSAVRSPFSSAGPNPVSIAVKPGGRFVYVVNEGTPADASDLSCTAKVAGNIAVFSVGGDGTLTFQTSYTSQGCTPVWAVVDSTGNYLYVLDQRSPAYGTVTTNADGSTTTDLNGDITVFSIDQTTGRLGLVTNTSVKNPITGTQLSYFEVGPHPIMMRTSASSCLYTVDQGDSTIFPYAIGTAGQLTLTTNSKIAVTATSVGGSQTPLLTSINTSGSSVYLTDAANNLLLPYTVGTNCALNTLTGGSIANVGTATDPVYSFTDSKGKYIYMLNQANSNSNVPNSSISAYVIDSGTGKISAIGDSNNPFSVGSGPVCMGEDPSNQYLYISNHNDGTVTGKIINQQQGLLSPLKRGTTFPTVGQTTCLAISGNVS